MSLDDTLPPLPAQDGIEFRHVAGFPGYAVGSDGSVWSAWQFRRLAGQRDGFKHYVGPGWRRLKESPFGKHGAYRCVYLRGPGRCGQKQQRIHRLVLLAFVGPCPSGMECCHGNGRHADNRLENLRWGTSLDNHRDALRHGTTRRGSRCPNSRLSEDQVVNIKLLLAQGTSQKEAARIYGVCAATVQLIAAGKTWKHVAPASGGRPAVVAALTRAKED